MKARKPRKHRIYEFERDAQGMPTKMTWLGDVDMQPRTQAERDAERLKEYERIYGKRAE